MFGTLRLMVTKLPSVLDSLEIWGRVRTLEIRDDASSPASATAAPTAPTKRSASTCASPCRTSSGWRWAASAASSSSTPRSSIRSKLAGCARATASTSTPVWDFRNKLSMSAAARADVSELANGLNFAGRGSVIYHAQKYALRLTIGAAYRDPTYVEVAGRFLDPKSKLILLEGTPGLNTPQITSIEAGRDRCALGHADYQAHPLRRAVDEPHGGELRTAGPQDVPQRAERPLADGWRARGVAAGAQGAVARGQRGRPVLAHQPGRLSPTVGTPTRTRSLTAWLGGAQQPPRRAHRAVAGRGLHLAAQLQPARRHSAAAPVNEGPDLVRIEAAADYKLSAKAPAVALAQGTVAPSS